MKKYFLLSLVALFFATPAWATWSVVGGGSPGDKKQITDGTWTLTLYSYNYTYNSVSYSGYKVGGYQSGSGELDLSTLGTDLTINFIAIDEMAFQNNTKITKLILPDSVTDIRKQAFNGCTALEEVRLPSSLIGWEYGSDHYGQFYNCSNLKYVYSDISDREEGTVVLGAGTTALPQEVFWGCSKIKKVSAPGVVDVYNRALAQMAGLEQVVLSPNLAVLRTNSSNWDQSAFYGKGTKDAALVDFSPSVFSSSFVMATNNPTSGGNGMFAYTGITNYIDMSACTFDTIPSLSFSWVPIAGATIPASVTTIKDQAFKQNTHSATFRFLGAPPTFDCQGQNTDNVPFRNSNGTTTGTSYNTIGTRHVFVVDAETYPAWTNQYFVSVADIKTSSNNEIKKYRDAVNNPTDSSYDFPTPEHPEETLGITNYGHRPNEYAWIVQYVDHSTVTVTWMNGTDVYDSMDVEINAAPVAPATNPAKASTAEFDYTFVGWNTDPDATTALDLSQLSLTANTTFYAIYTAAKRSYTITWKRDNDTVIDTTTVLYGATPTHADATKESDSEYAYSFNGWSIDGETVLGSIPAVTGAATYIAVFTQHELDATVTIHWLEENGATPLDPASTTVEKGTRPTHAEPTKDPDVGTVYTFDGWIRVGDPESAVIPSAELPLATEDCTYKAHFASSVRQYTITFANWDGAVISATAYDYGTAPGLIAVPSDPTRAADAEYTYTFAGWNSEVAQVAGDATYTATYTATAKEYDATFVDGIDESVISGPTTYAFGAAVTAPAAPEHKGYTFAAWSPEVGTMPSADTTYTATYTPNKFTITWVNGDTTTTAQYDYHTEVAAITVPAGKKNSTSKASYTFVGWSPAIEPVESNTTYTATFTMNILSPMTIALDSAAYDRSQGEATVVTKVGNTDAAATTTVEATAQFRTLSVPGEATVNGATVTSVFDNFASGRGYEWTITATQTYGAEYSGASESASIKGRTYARTAKSWFGNDDVSWNEGAFAPAAQSGSGAQVRLRAKVTFPAVLPRALPVAENAVVGITACQPNAGVAPRYYAWNGSQWVKLAGVAPKGGVEVNLLGVVDFARKDGPAVAWYADGFQLTTEEGDWEVPLAGGTKLTSFGLVGDLSVDSLSGDYDIGGQGFCLIVR